MEHFISETSIDGNEIVSCKQSDEAGISIKSELPALNGSTVYIELTKKDNNFTFEHFISLADIKSRKIINLK